MPNVSSIVKAIQKAVVSNEAKKRLLKAAAKPITQKEIKQLIRTEMRTGALNLGRANRVPGPKNPPKRLVENRTGSGVKSGAKPEKRDPAKDIFNMYKNELGRVDKSIQKERVTPADVIAKRIKATKAGKDTSAKAAKAQKPKKKSLSEEARIKAKGSAVRSKGRGATKIETDEPQGYWIPGKEKGDPRQWVSTERDAGLMPRSNSTPTIASREKAPSTSTPDKPTKFSRKVDKIASDAIRKTNALEALKKAQLDAAIKASRVKSSPDKAKAIAQAKAAARRVEILAKKAGPDAKPVSRRTLEQALRMARQKRSGTTPAQKARAQRTEIAKGKLTQAQLNEIKKIAARIKKAGK